MSERDYTARDYALALACGFGLGLWVLPLGVLLLVLLGR